MRKRLLALTLGVCLLLSGCVNLAGRSYETSRRHTDKPVTAEDDSYIRVEGYQELVSAVLYLVSQGEEEGVIRLYDYDGDVEEDLAAACLEVAAQDPLGAYAVDYIKHEYTRVVSYYQASLSIRYRRAKEQIDSIVRVTGSSAIRAQLRKALADFTPQVVLRVAYFAEDEDSLAQLIRQAYYDTPACALGMPEVELALYPDAGRERVVEILLTYPEPAADLEEKREEITRRAEDAAAYQTLEPAAAIRAVVSDLSRQTRYDPEGASTAYAALVDGAADREGLALACALLGQSAGLKCDIVNGQRQGEDWTWNAIQLPDGMRYLDLTRDRTLRTAKELAELGYLWPGAPVSPSGDDAG